MRPCVQQQCHIAESANWPLLWRIIAAAGVASSHDPAFKYCFSAHKQLMEQLRWRSRVPLAGGPFGGREANWDRRRNPVARRHGSGGAEGESRCGGGATVGAAVGVCWHLHHQPLRLTLETKDELLCKLSLILCSENQ